jgi:rSAM/selenodomain-associated transferase 1
MDCEENRHLNQPVCAIAIMAKQPEPGKVKTRLCPPLSPGQAADLYEAFFLDTVSLVSGIEHTDLFVAYDPDTARDFFSRRVSAAVKCIPQGSGDLGDRLVGISHRMFVLGYRKLIILASDTPLLPRGVVRCAIARLDVTDVVLGPCDDGGYYLIGLRSCAPTLFAEIPWSTSQVLDRTIRRAQEAGMTWELLPFGYDIDTWEDAERLRNDLKGNAANDSDGCMRTKKALRYLVPEHAAQPMHSSASRHPFRDR